MTVKPRLEAVGADLDRVHFVLIRTGGGDEDGLTIPDDLPSLEQLVGEKEARLLVVDPLTAHLAEGLNTWNDHSVRRALAPLARLAHSTGAAALAVLHLNKGTGSDPMRRIGGSVAFSAAPRSVLLFARDPDDPEGEQGRRRVLAHHKCNVAPEAPSLLYEFEPILIPAVGDEPEVETARLALLGETHHSGRDLLGSASDENRSELEDAVAFLEGELSPPGLQRPSKDVLIAGRESGFSQRTLERAKKRLGVESVHEGTPGRSGGGRWLWELPPSKSAKPRGGLAVGARGGVAKTGSTIRDSNPFGAARPPYESYGALAPNGPLSEEQICELGRLPLDEIRRRAEAGEL